MGNRENEKLKQELSEKEAEKKRIESEKKAEEKRHQDEIRHQEELQKMREDMLNKQLEQYQKMISLSKEENERRVKEQEERDYYLSNTLLNSSTLILTGSTINSGRL